MRRRILQSEQGKTYIYKEGKFADFIGEFKQGGYTRNNNSTYENNGFLHMENNGSSTRTYGSGLVNLCGYKKLCANVTVKYSKRANDGNCCVGISEKFIIHNDQNISFVKWNKLNFIQKENMEFDGVYKLDIADFESIENCYVFVCFDVWGETTKCSFDVHEIWLE